MMHQAQQYQSYPPREAYRADSFSSHDKLLQQDFGGIWKTSLYVDTHAYSSMSSLPQEQQLVTSAYPSLHLWEEAGGAMKNTEFLVSEPQLFFDSIDDRENEFCCSSEEEKGDDDFSPPVLHVVVFSSRHVSDIDDEVSVLYDDPDIDDTDCLPPSTIDVLHQFFNDMEGYDDDDDSDYDDEIDSMYCYNEYTER